MTKRKPTRKPVKKSKKPPSGHIIISGDDECKTMGKKTRKSTVSRTLAADTSGSPDKGEVQAENSTAGVPVRQQEVTPQVDKPYHGMMMPKKSRPDSARPLEASGEHISVQNLNPEKAQVTFTQCGVQNSSAEKEYSLLNDRMNEAISLSNNILYNHNSYAKFGLGYLPTGTIDYQKVYEHGYADGILKPRLDYFLVGVMSLLLLESFAACVFRWWGG